MQRTLLPEFLDNLPHDHPDALHSRRDLRSFNRLMGNYNWIIRTLSSHLRPNDRILEIGAGCGSLSSSLRTAGILNDALDLCPKPHDWPSTLRWYQTDILSFQDWHEYSVVVANLFFHHFESSSLLSIGNRLATHSRLLIACEPVRKRHYQRLFALYCRFIQANRISRYDGHVSIGAGFINDELPRALALSSKWKWQVQDNLRGASNMIAIKHTAS